MCVMKQIDIAKMKKAQREEALNEAKILSALNSPYIVAYHESFIENEKLCIIMEFCENGDLSQFLKAKRGKHLDELTVWKYFIQICLALQYLHSKKILHRDIKTMNVFLTKDFQIRLGDLGVAKVLNQNANFAHTMVGTPYYLSPELCQEKPYNEKSDVWSLGCVLYEAAALHPLFRATDMQGLYRKVVAGAYSDIPKGYSAELSQVIKGLLQLNPMLRPSCQQVLDMSAIQRKVKELGIGSEGTIAPAGNILGTIVFPKHISALSSRLPKPNYAIPQVSQLPQLQKYSAISGSLQNRSKSINGGRAGNASVGALEPVKEEEKRPSERHLKPRYMR